MGRYDDIINLPHKLSDKRAHMPNRDRAAQFSPFAALTGHSDAIEETARLTDGKIILGEYEAELLNEKLKRLISEPRQKIRVTYFVSDDKKHGGRYVTQTKTVRRVDEALRRIIFEDKSKMGFEEIADIEFIGKVRNVD